MGLVGMCVNAPPLLPSPLPCDSIPSLLHQAKEVMEEFKSIVGDQKQLRRKGTEVVGSPV